MDEHYESNFTVSVRHDKCVAHLQKTCDISGFLTDSGADVNYCLPGHHRYTRSIG